MPGISATIKRYMKSISIKKKLMVIIMAVSLIGLGTVGASILLNELINLNKMQKVDLQVMADIVAETSSGYLVFNDDEGADISLASLRAKKQIVRAIIYGHDKQVFVVYSRDGDNRRMVYDQIRENNLTSDTFFVVKEIIVDNDLAGYLYLESDYSLIQGFIVDSIIGLIFIIILGSLIAYFLAAKLQKIISEPIEHLTKTALKITQQQDYSLRAEKESDDEVGVLTDEFNEMLVQLQKRNNKLIESENKFREVVEQSTDALFILDEGGEFIDVNNSACEALGYEREELLTKSVADIDGIYNDRDKMQGLLEELTQKKHIIVDSVHFRKNNKSFPVEMSLGFVNIEGKRLILASVRDITERKQAQESMQQANELLEAKVDERTQELISINIDLENAKKKAESASYAKSLFLANMSHEIRTPMNAIIGFTDLLASSELGDKQTEYIRSIQSGSRNLLSLINDILDLSKIEAGKIKINSDKIYVKHLLKDIYQVFYNSAKEKGLELSLNVDESVPELLMSDEIRLRQILFNLLNNAIKFTREGGIKIHAEYKRVSAENIYYSMIFRVEDTGIGVRKSDQENIFNIFEQQDNQNTREFGGAGLGLAISSRLAEKLGAIITVESEPGEGSVFQLLLKNPEIVQKDKPKNEPTISRNIVFKTAKVLIVDDVELNRELVCEYLTNQPLTLIEAKNGKQAVELVKSEKPDVVLMDIRMPIMNGIIATEIIKNDLLLCHTPVIALTASVVGDERTEMKKSLFDMVLYKPLNRITLMESLAKFIEIEAVNESVIKDIECDSLYHEEVKSVSGVVAGILMQYQQPLEKAKNRGSFSGLDQLLDELHEVAKKYDMPGLSGMLDKLKNANQVFDIEETQKIISKILVGISELPRINHDKTI